MQNALWVGLALLAAYLYLRPSAPAEARLNAQALRALRASDPNLQLIDVRTPEEFAEGHLKGAKNIPLDYLSGRLGEIAKDQAVALYCRSGSRSGSALRILHANNFPGAKHLEGGILAWQREGLSL